MRDRGQLPSPTPCRAPKARPWLPRAPLKPGWMLPSHAPGAQGAQTPGAALPGAALLCSPRKGTPASLASSSPPPREKTLVHS